MRFPSDFSAVDGRDGWFKTPTALQTDWANQEARVLSLHQRYPLPTQIVVGLLGDDPGHSIYVIENASAIDVAREFKTGSHNLFDGSESILVYEELTRVFRVVPFRPYFVDAAGYKAKFSDPLTEAQAMEIEGILTEGLDGYISEYTGEGPLLAHTLIAENKLRLWWD